MRLYIVRHGQTSWNKEGRAQGHSENVQPVGLAPRLGTATDGGTEGEGAAAARV